MDDIYGIDVFNGLLDVTWYLQEDGSPNFVPSETVDLSLTKTDSIDPVEPDSDLAYTLVTTNASAVSFATGVILMD